MSADHGTTYYYRKFGCRCDPCCEAKRITSRQAHANHAARKTAGLPSPGIRVGRPSIPLSERPHGSYVTYAKGCRCRPCTEANSEYGRERKAIRELAEWERTGSLRD